MVKMMWRLGEIFCEVSLGEFVVIVGLELTMFAVLIFGLGG
jgi:hypothetical protein